eukprot:29811_1
MSTSHTENRGTKRDNSDLLSTNDSNNNTKNPRASKRRRRDTNNNDKTLPQRLKKAQISKHNIYKKQIIQKDNSPNTSAESDVSDTSSDEFEEDNNTQKQQQPQTPIITNRKTKRYYTYVPNTNIPNTNINTPSTNTINTSITTQSQPTQHISFNYNTQQTQSTHNNVNESQGASDQAENTFRKPLVTVSLIVVALFLFVVFSINYLIVEPKDAKDDAKNDAKHDTKTHDYANYISDNIVRDSIMENRIYSIKVSCNSQDFGFMSYQLGIIAYEYMLDDSRFSFGKFEHPDFEEWGLLFVIINEYPGTAKHLCICQVDLNIIELKIEYSGLQLRECNKINKNPWKLVFWKFHPTNDKNLYELEAFVGSRKIVDKKLVWKLQSVGWAGSKKLGATFGTIHPERAYSCRYLVELNAKLQHFQIQTLSNGLLAFISKQEY